MGCSGSKEKESKLSYVLGFLTNLNIFLSFYLKINSYLIFREVCYQRKRG